MTAHTCRLKRSARGTPAGNMVRVMASLGPDDMRRLVWWARKNKIPVAKVIRNAIWVYLLPIAVDADRAAEAEATKFDQEAA